VTCIFHVSPVLSCAVADVPVVMMLRGREFGVDSGWGGCSILSAGALACGVPRACMLKFGRAGAEDGCVQDYQEVGLIVIKAAKSLMTVRSAKGRRKRMRVWLTRRDPSGVAYTSLVDPGRPCLSLRLDERL
jgi:hypothetical protein